MPPTDVVTDLDLDLDVGVDVGVDPDLDVGVELRAVRCELKLMLEWQVSEDLGLEARARYEHLLAREQLLLIRDRRSRRP